MEAPNKTKVVATIGPVSEQEDKIFQLTEAGVDLFRLNTSHGTPEEHKNRILNVRKAAKAFNKNSAVLVDLQGPKIRVGNLIENIMLEKEQVVVIKPSLTQESPDYIPVDYSGIVNDVQPGDKVLLDDGKIHLEVISFDTEKVTAKVVQGGLLKSRKGLNIPGTTASLSAITPRDIEFIKFAVENDADYIACSFVRSAEDIVTAKQYIKEFGGDIPVIAKVEKPQAIENLDGIIAAADAIMVARGDLGIEISPENVPVIQKEIIQKCNEQRKLVITATQMLESMMEQLTPTRAEASDIANAILDGTDATMLSGETAAGDHPIEAVKMMKLIGQKVETSKIYKHNQYDLNLREVYEMDAHAISTAVIKMLDELDIASVVAFTRSGFTAKLLSKAKPSVPVIALSDNIKACRRLNPFWGVFPYHVEFEMNFSEGLLEHIDEYLIKNTFLKPGDKVIITGGLPYLSEGKTNFLRIHQIGAAASMK